MESWRHPRLHDPANWWLLLGISALVLSIWFPWFTADRTARIERRAEAVATVLLEAARDVDAGWDAASLAFVEARLLALAIAREVHLADLERVFDRPTALLTFTNKHYAFQLAATPPPARAMPSLDSVPALEVVAWPLASSGPGHSVFFLPENASRAYTRNKGANHHGLAEAAPAPGACQRPTEHSSAASHYRSTDDERWILY